MLLNLRLFIHLFRRCFSLLACTWLLMTGLPVFAVETEEDGMPKQQIDFSNASFPSPVFEPLSKFGNQSPYTVLGRTYKITPHPQQYRAKGMASWYGTKFHGRYTSNGEIYDMYSFTAAHRNLPLPTWLKVTNLENGRWLYVRVNDRGPFYGRRIIDLSYATASYLGMLQNGIARVLLEYAGVDSAQAKSLALHSSGIDSASIARNGLFVLQVGAFREINRARGLVNTLRTLDMESVLVHPKIMPDGGVIFRVRVGPSSLEAARRSQALVSVAVDDIDFPIIERLSSTQIHAETSE